MLGSRETDTMNNADIYGTYKNLYLSKKNAKRSYFNWLKVLGRWKKQADGTATTVATQENTVKKTIAKRFLVPLDFDFFKHPVYPYGLKEDLIVRLCSNMQIFRYFFKI